MLLPPQWLEEKFVEEERVIGFIKGNRMKIKKFELELGDTIVLYRGTVDINDKDAQRKHLGNWDVVKINKKSVVLQNWPTYELRRIKFW